MSYTYKDLATGKIKRTRGQFAGWSDPTGPLHVRYAIFRNPRGVVYVPIYCLTQQTKALLAPPSDRASAERMH